MRPWHRVWLSQSPRFVDECGHIHHNRSWTIHNLTVGLYHWSVQTFDSSFALSEFISSGPVFVIPPNNGDCADAIDVVNGSHAFENLAGPDLGAGNGCESFDFNYDGDIDLSDSAEFQVRQNP